MNLLAVARVLPAVGSRHIRLLAAAIAPPSSRRLFSSNNHDSTHHRQPTSRQVGLDYYAILEVHRHHLRADDLKQSYYRLAKQYHPDRLAHLADADRTRAEKKFAQIGVAYAVLSDPAKRQQYDIFSDLSSIGDQDRTLHWVKINRPPDQLGFDGFTPQYETGYDGHKKKHEATTPTTPADATVASGSTSTTAAAATASSASAPTSKSKASKLPPGFPKFQSS